jgi:tetratricopeptide (TPR) repeat protein
MMTSDVEDTVELRPTLPPLSEATRASLIAVRRAQEAARERARRETVRARVGVGVLVTAIAAAVIVLGPPVKRRLVAARAAAAATSSPAPVAALAAAAEAPLAAPAPEPAPALPTEVAPVEAAPANALPARTQTAPARAPAVSASAASSPAESACAETLDQHRWQISIDECTRLFESHPGDAALALRIAHAHHAKGHVADAGEWAKKAITLDPNLAEGFVLVARAEKLAGRPDGALQAYRQYLGLAPRGWHSAEARAAVRAAPAEAPHARADGRSSTGSSFAARQ